MFPLSLTPPKNAEKAFKKDFFSSYPTTTRTYAHFTKKVDSSVAGFPRKQKRKEKIKE